MNKKLKFVSITILVASIIGLVLTGCGGSANPTTTATGASSSTTNIASGNESLDVSVDKQQANGGDTFTVNVMINTQIASRGAQAALNFDPSTMECTSVTEGNFYKDWATTNGISTTMMPSSPNIDNVKGTVEMTAVAIMGQSAAEQSGKAFGGAQGQGIFLSYQMKAKSGVNKTASIKISDVALMDSNANAIKGVTAKNGQINIGTP